MNIEQALSFRVGLGEFAVMKGEMLFTELNNYLQTRGFYMNDKNISIDHVKENLKATYEKEGYNLNLGFDIIKENIYGPDFVIRLTSIGDTLIKYY